MAPVIVIIIILLDDYYWGILSRFKVELILTPFYTHFIELAHVLYVTLKGNYSSEINVGKFTKCPSLMSLSRSMK